MISKLKNEEKKKILDFIKNLAKIAQQRNWISRYDKDNDSFVMRKPKLSKSACKRYINDEFAFYFNEKNNIEGVFIEYAFSNLVSHHKTEFKIFDSTIKKRKKETKEALVELKKTETKKVAFELENVIIDSVIGGFSCVCSC